MNRVIRTARISDHTVVLPVQVDPGMMELPEIGDGEASEGFTPLGEHAEVILDDDVVNPEEPEIDVEAIVEERLQEADARFQQEKEEAVQASFEAGLVQGTEAGLVQGTEEGRAQGDQEGYTRGLAEGQAQSHDEIVRFQSMLEALGQRWSDLFKTADRDMTELAMAIARNVVGGLVEGHKEVVLDAVQDCLGHVQDRARVVIRVHPDDLELVRNHREEWQREFEQIESLLIEADDTIGQGGCLVETPSGDIDAQIESRLDKLKIALMEAVQNAPAEHAPILDLEEEKSDDVEDLTNDASVIDEEVDVQDDSIEDVASESDLEIEEDSQEEPEQNLEADQSELEAQSDDEAETIVEDDEADQPDQPEEELENIVGEALVDEETDLEALEDEASDDLDSGAINDEIETGETDAEPEEGSDQDS